MYVSKQNPVRLALHQVEELETRIVSNVNSFVLL